jgi:hypothetical protein
VGVASGAGAQTASCPPSLPWRDCVGAGPSGPFPATASAEGRLIKGGPSPTLRGRGPQAQGRQHNSEN